MPRLPRRLLPVWLLVVFAVPIGGVAHAYWAASGGGAGSAATGTTLAVTVSPGTVAPTLYPGGQADVALIVSNPNAFSVGIGSFALATAQGTGGFAVDAAHSALGCSVAAATLSFASSSVGWTVPANSSLPVQLTNKLGMGAGSASACQGASFTVYVAAGP